MQGRIGKENTKNLTYYFDWLRKWQKFNLYMILILIAAFASVALPLVALIFLIDEKNEQRRIHRLMSEIEKCPEEYSYLQSKSADCVSN
jgi:hypothetical protein